MAAQGGNVEALALLVRLDPRTIALPFFAWTLVFHKLTAMSGRRVLSQAERTALFVVSRRPSSRTREADRLPPPVRGGGRAPELQVTSRMVRVLPRLAGRLVVPWHYHGSHALWRRWNEALAQVVRREQPRRPPPTDEAGFRKAWLTEDDLRFRVLCRLLRRDPRCFGALVAAEVCRWKANTIACYRLSPDEPWISMPREAGDRAGHPTSEPELLAQHYRRNLQGIGRTIRLTVGATEQRRQGDDVDESVEALKKLGAAIAFTVGKGKQRWRDQNEVVASRHALKAQLDEAELLLAYGAPPDLVADQVRLDPRHVQALAKGQRRVDVRDAVLAWEWNGLPGDISHLGRSRRRLHA